MRPAHLQAIVNAFPPEGPENDVPARFQALLERSRAGHADLDQLLGEIDDSDYSLADWIRALLAFDRWLERCGTQVHPFAEMTGYLACCAAAAPATVGTLPALQDLLLQNLEEYGFDAAQPAKKF